MNTLKSEKGSIIVKAHSLSAIIDNRQLDDVNIATAAREKIIQMLEILEEMKDECNQIIHNGNPNNNIDVGNIDIF